MSDGLFDRRDARRGPGHRALRCPLGCFAHTDCPLAHYVRTRNLQKMAPRNPGPQPTSIPSIIPRFRIIPDVAVSIDVGRDVLQSESQRSHGSRPLDRRVPRISATGGSVRQGTKCQIDSLFRPRPRMHWSALVWAFRKTSPSHCPLLIAVSAP
jgi:hypothetical protein